MVYDTHTEPVFKELGILTFFKICMFYLGKFLFFYHKQILPANFNNFFHRVNQVRSYNTRNSKLCFVYFCRINIIKQFSVVYLGVKLFNSLSEDVCGTFSVSSERK